MTTEIYTPSVVEIHAYEVKARALRAQAMREGLQALSDFVKSVIHRVSATFTRPVHA